MQDLNGCGSCGSVDIVTRAPCNQKVLYSIASCCASFPTRWLADARALLLVSPDSSRHRSETSRSLPRATTLEEAHDGSLTKHRPSRCRRSLAPRSFSILKVRVRGMALPLGASRIACHRLTTRVEIFDILVAGGSLYSRLLAPGPRHRPTRGFPCLGHSDGL